MTTKSNRISISDGIQVIGLVLLAITVFIGANFLYSGNLAFSIPITLITIGSIWGITYGLVAFKAAKTHKNDRKNQEFIFMAMYVIIAGVSFYFYNHFMNTQFGPKEELMLAGKAKVNTVADLIRKNDTYLTYLKDSYKLQVEMDINSGDYKESDGLDLRSLHIDKLSLMRMKGNSLYDRLEFEALPTLTEANSFLIKSEQTIDSWNPLSIPSFFNEIDATITRFRDELVTASKVLPFGAETPFEFNLSDDNDAFSDLKSKLTNFEVKANTIVINLIVFIVLHFLILWIYLFKNRESNGKVKKMLDDNIIEM